MYAYRVNFLPPQIQREGIIDFRRLILIGGATLLLVLTLGGYGAFIINYYGMRNELTSTKQQLASLAPLVTRVEGIVKERKELEATLEEYNLIRKKHVAWSDLLYDLGDIAPVDLWLTEIDISRKDPAAKEQSGGTTKPAEQKTAESQQASPAKTVAGQEQKERDTYSRPNMITYRGASQTVSSIGVFIRNLIGLPYFEEVKLVKISTDNNELKFEITAKIKEVEN